MGKWKTRIGYGVADLASNLVFAMMSSYLLIFYTDVFGITAAVAGSVMMVTRVIDGFTDVGMGLLIDRTNTRWGKSRPYFLFGSVPFALIAVATFTVPNLGMNGKIVWAFVTYIALSCAYTVVNIPLSTILPTLTSDDKERTILVTVRMICSMLGATIVTTFTTPLIHMYGGNNASKGYLLTIITYAVIAAALFFVTFKNTEEKVHVAVKEGKSSVKKDFMALNGQCIIMFLLGFFYFSVYTIRSSSIVYYFTYNLEKVNLIPLIGILGTFSGLPVLLLLPFIIGKIGKKKAVIVGAIIYIAGTLVIWGGGKSMVAIVAGLVTTGCGMYLMQGTFFAISPDAMDYCIYKSGRDISGMITAFTGFLAKLAMGVSGFAIGQLLEHGGYVQNAKQTASALASIEFSFVWIPIGLCVVIIVLIAIGYKLDKIKPGMEAELEKRRTVEV